uniref:Uncharacterized protein n=1 Tax=Arundo donax TaxID=35708 RepID=A0A0A8XU44_ARUDO
MTTYLFYFVQVKRYHPKKEQRYYTL